MPSCLSTLRCFNCTTAGCTWAQFQGGVEKCVESVADLAHRLIRQQVTPVDSYGCPDNPLSPTTLESSNFTTQPFVDPTTQRVTTLVSSIDGDVATAFQEQLGLWIAAVGGVLVAVGATAVVVGLCIRRRGSTRGYRQLIEEDLCGSSTGSSPSLDRLSDEDDEEIHYQSPARVIRDLTHFMRDKSAAMSSSGIFGVQRPQLEGDAEEGEGSEVDSACYGHSTHTYATIVADGESAGDGGEDGSATGFLVDLQNGNFEQQEVVVDTSVGGGGAVRSAMGDRVGLGDRSFEQVEVAVESDGEGGGAFIDQDDHVEAVPCDATTEASPVHLVGPVAPRRTERQTKLPAHFRDYILYGDGLPPTKK